MPRSGAEQRRRIVLEWENDSWQPRYAGAAILAKVFHGALHSRVASLPAISKQDQAIGSQVRQRDERWLIALSQVLPYLAAYRTLKPDLDFGFARRPSRPVAYQSLSFCDASHV